MKLFNKDTKERGTTMDDWKSYEGKRVFIKLVNGREYSGKVLEANSTWLLILDKFNKQVKIQGSEISVIEQEGAKNG